MNQQKISQALTQGLMAEFNGKTIILPVTRGSFNLTSSHFEDGSIICHDEWTDGGGQEIVKVEDEMFTRVYAGRAIGETKEIITKLIYFIQTLKDKTRLFSDCELTADDWQYEYKIIDSESDVTTGKETIKYQNQTVFIHVFVLSPINQ